MERRDFVISILSAGLGPSLVPMTLAPMTKRPQPAKGRDPVDFGKMQIQETLLKVFPERNLVIPGDDYFGVQTEILYLGIRRIADFHRMLEQNRAHAVALDQQMVANILALKGSRPHWLTDGIVRRVTETGAFLTQVGLARTVLIKEFGDQYRFCDTAKLARSLAERTPRA
jgi:hypothetical protein